MVVLRGLTWNHVRAYGPLLATASTYMARHPGVRIEWESRSLQELNSYPVEQLTDRYDLLLIDHPFVAVAAATGCLLPLDEYLDQAYLADQGANSTGPSHASYGFGGHQWALAVDASAQVSAYRPDLLQQIDCDLPRSWEAVLALGRRLLRQGRCIALSLRPFDALMSFFSLCLSAGEQPCSTSDAMVSRAVGRQALELLRLLCGLSHPQSLTWSPAQLLDRMATSAEIVYAPLLFGYSNYARPGFRSRLVLFTDVPSYERSPVGSVLGGAGIAVSWKTAQPPAAIDYVRYVAGPEIQRTLYFDGGGQPGHRSAWLAQQTNAAACNYFVDTLDTMEQAWVRPRYTGYLQMQQRAGLLIYRYLSEDGDPEALLAELDDCYLRSQSVKIARQ